MRRIYSPASLEEQIKKPRDKYQLAPRLGITITKEQQKGLSRIPWGQKTMLFKAIVDDLNILISSIGPELTIAKILSKNLDLQFILTQANALRQESSRQQPSTVDDKRGEEKEEKEEEEEEEEPNYGDSQ